MALPKAHHIETLSGFNSLKFSYDSTNTHYFTGGTSTVVEGTPDILYTDIAYIKPLSAIYTHAKIYPCPVLEYDDVPTDGSNNPVTSAGIKAAIDAVAQSAAQGLKCVDLSTYQGTTPGEIVKHVGPTTVDYTNGYDYKYNSTSSSVPILTLTDVDVSLSNLVPASQETASAWTSLRTPFYIHRTYDTEEEDSHSNAYHLIFFADSESIDESSAIMIGYNLDIENPTVQVGDYVYTVSNDSPLYISDQVVNVNGTKFTTESGRVYDTTNFDYYDYLCWLINEDGEEVVAFDSLSYSDGSTADTTFIYPKLHLSDRITFTETRYNPSISVPIYSTTTTSSWVQTDAQPRDVYTAGTGLKLSNNQFSLNIPRVTRTANSLPGVNTAIFEEYSSGDNYDLPSNALYHIITMQGNDTTAATQLALCVNNDAVYYRRMTSSIWQPWICLNPTMDSTPTAGNTSNTVSSAGVKTAIDTAVTDVKEWVVQRYPYYTIYGVQWNTADPSPECVRIGYSSLHVTLPIQSGMVGGTLTDEGVFTPFTHTDDWTSETRDGSIGQVMVKIPSHWRRFEFENTIVRLLMSATPVEGFMEVPEQYVSAYEASLDRTNLKLASVVNLTAQYRGGNNNATWDSEDTAGQGGESHRSLLGRPATNIDLTNFRTYARARKSGETWWNCNTYEVQRALYWLYVVEYATLNSQKAYDASTTTEGYKKGGLGDGVSTWTSDAWNSFNSYYPFVPCGWTDTLGNGSGVRNYTVYNASGTALKTFAVPRYRGIENPWGHIWKHTDGILCNVTASTSPIYATDDPADFSSTSYSAMRLIGNEMRNEAYIKELHLGENGDITAKSGNGSSTSYYCDYHYTNTSSTGLRAVLFGGYALLGANDGFVLSFPRFAPSHTSAALGSRLCFKRTT